jgi:hypothetical protein
MIVKQHITPDRRLFLTICDEDVVGKLYEEGERQLDLTARYYQGEKIPVESALSLARKAASIQAVGKDAVNHCVKWGFLDKGQIVTVQGIPHGQMIRL